MRLLESKRGMSFFAFEHSEEYQQTQHKFLLAVESMEPNNIVVCNPAAPGQDGARSCIPVVFLSCVALVTRGRCVWGLSHLHSVHMWHTDSISSPWEPGMGCRWPP